MRYTYIACLFSFFNKVLFLRGLLPGSLLGPQPNNGVSTPRSPVCCLVKTVCEEVKRMFYTDTIFIASLEKKLFSASKVEIGSHRQYGDMIRIFFFYFRGK
jgi:hypothetical protein